MQELFAGDKGYPLQPYLITPYRSAAERSAESIFNGKHAKVRNIVERTIGVLKNRFRCLLGARQLHYKPSKVTTIANVCAALHNICIQYGIDFPIEDIDASDEDDDEINDEYEYAPSAEASQIREQIKTSFL